jgi:hypothetical protein
LFAECFVLPSAALGKDLICRVPEKDLVSGSV